MTKKNSQNIDLLLNKVKKNLNDLLGNNSRKCVLFGSYSLHEQTADSDVDVLVLANLSNDQIKSLDNKFTAISVDLSLEHDVVLSLIVKNAEEFYEYSDAVPFYNNIVKEGKTIYG